MSPYNNLKIKKSKSKLTICKNKSKKNKVVKMI